MSQRDIYRSKIANSYGIIVFTYIQDELHFLMTLRRDTFCYECILRGMYAPDQLNDYITHITMAERDRLLNHPFDLLWKDLWVSTKRRLYRIEYKKAKEKFTENYAVIMEGVRSLQSFDNETWEFPKGKMFSDETPLQCALREFEEETNIHQSNVLLVKSAGTFLESFIGCDRKKYQSLFHLGLIHDGASIVFSYRDCPHNIRERYVSDEVMSIGWFSFRDAMYRCSPTKQTILQSVQTFLIGKPPGFASPLVAPTPIPSAAEV